MDYQGGFPIEEGLISRRIGFNEGLRELRISHAHNEQKPRLVCGMIVRNEERHIARCLDSLSKYVDSVVIIDNGSTDATVDICRSYPVVEIVESHPEPWHEGQFKNRLLHLCRKVGARWILGIDADEMLEEHIARELPALLRPLDPLIDTYAFYLLNFWNGEQEFRIDPRWKPTLRIRLFRDRPNYYCDWSPTHVGINPVNLHWKRVRISSIRLMHWGYSDFEVAKSKYEFYTAKNPERDFTWLIDHTCVRTEPYIANAGNCVIGQLTLPASKRFLRECFLAGRWLRRCDAPNRKDILDAFCEKCLVDSVTKTVRAGYKLGIV